MRIVQIYPQFRIFDLRADFFSGFGHCHISGSLNFIKNIFQIFFCPAILIDGGETACLQSSCFKCG